jgi:hypothetical protein
MIEAGHARRAKLDVSDLEPPLPGPDLSGALVAQRDAERY